MKRFKLVSIAAISFMLTTSSCSGQGGFGAGGGAGAKKDQNIRPRNTSDNPTPNTGGDNQQSDTPINSDDQDAGIETDEQIAGAPIAVSGAFLTMGCGAADMPPADVPDGYRTIGCGAYDNTQQLYAGDITFESMILVSSTNVSTSVDISKASPAPANSKYSHNFLVLSASMIDLDSIMVTMSMAGERHENYTVALDRAGLVENHGCDPTATHICYQNPQTYPDTGDPMFFNDDVMINGWDSGASKDVFVAIEWNSSNTPKILRIKPNWNPLGEQSINTTSKIELDVNSGTKIIDQKTLQSPAIVIPSDWKRYSDHKDFICLPLDNLDSKHKAILIKFKKCEKITCAFHEIDLLF